jgi:hypothetical protein
MDSLEVSLGNKLNPPLTKANITHIKVSLPSPQCLQSCITGVNYTGENFQKLLHQYHAVNK